MNNRNEEKSKKANDKKKVCASCGEDSPEYVLDDRNLCFDCYKAERYYWAKESL